MLPHILRTADAMNHKLFNRRVKDLNNIEKVMCTC